MILKTSKQRQGVTAVEFALTVPILFLFLFGTYEMGRANMMLHTTEAAAYEGARTSIVPGATPEEAIAAARSVLATVGIRNADITITPTDLESASETVSVNISFLYKDNSTIFPFFLGEEATVDRTCQLSREIL